MYLTTLWLIIATSKKNVLMPHATMALKKTWVRQTLRPQKVSLLTSKSMRSPTKVSIKSGRCLPLRCMMLTLDDR